MRFQRAMERQSSPYRQANHGQRLARPHHVHRGLLAARLLRRPRPAHLGRGRAAAPRRPQRAAAGDQHHQGEGEQTRQRSASKPSLPIHDEIVSSARCRVRVGMNRSDGHEARVHRVEVRIRRVVARRTRLSEPVDAFAGRVPVGDGRPGAVPVPESRHPHAFDPIQGQVRHVHVEHRPRRNGAVPERPDQPFHDRGRGLVAVRVPPHQRDRDRRQTEMAALERRRHSARVQHVVPEVPARVDARHHEVRVPIEKPGEREVDAVGRRALDHDEAVLARFRPKRNAERERVARSAPIPVGGRYRHLPVLREGAPQAHEPRRAVAIVIAQEDAHRPPCCADPPRPAPQEAAAGAPAPSPRRAAGNGAARPRREGSSQNGNP